MIAAPLIGAMIVLVCVAASVRAIQFSYRYLAAQALYWGRSKVFEIGLDCPEARESELYRDTDYILATALHVFRDLPAEQGIRFASAWLSDSNKPADEPSEPSTRLTLYRLESEELPQEVTADLLEVYNVISPAIAFWHLSQSPLFAVFFLAVLPVVVLLVVLSSVTRSLARSITVVLRAPKIDDAGSVARVAPLADQVNSHSFPGLSGQLPQLA